MNKSAYLAARRMSFSAAPRKSGQQGRYVLRHPWKGTANCPAADAYRASLAARFKKEAATLADLTGWSPQDIEARMEATGQSLKGSNGQ
jgi:hypothetical protein